MTPLKRSLSILGRSCRTLCSNKSFHTASPIRAKNSPKRSPAVARKLGKSTPGVLRTKKSYHAEECLPPVALLQSARKSGALEIEVEKAVEVLREYQEVEATSSKGWEQKLCNDYNIRPATLTLLGQILRRCTGEGQKHLARKLMLSASELGDRTATFELVSSAMRKGTTDSYFGLVQRCKQLATRESDPQAMLLLGKICLVQRRENEAFDWFSKATQSPSSVGFPGSSEALVHVGRILQSRKENSKAADAFRRAALELGDPSAYFYLSQMEEPGSPQQEVYLLKAASGGIVEAWHNLGSLELAKIEKQAAEPKAVQDYGMAREWFQVAAADGFGLSMLNMAVICKSGGQLESGVRWLERAEEVPEVSEQAKRLKDQWESQKK